MRIALYGDNVEVLQKRADDIREFFLNNGTSFVIDRYTDERLLKTNLLQYDFVCTTDQFSEILKNKERHEVAFAYGKKLESYYVDEIYYAEAELKNTHIWHRENETLISLAFSEITKILEKESFIRIHRSYLINCMYIKSMTETSVCLKNGVELPISKYRRKKVFEEYQKYLQTDK